MDTERPLLSCPGRVQDWLGAAADQIETLLQVPQPSLSGSDLAIGALILKRDRPSWMTGPNSDALPVTDQVPPSISEKSSRRCERCVAEKRGQCSRDLPSCTRCRKNGLLCFYTEGLPTSRLREGRPGPSVEPFLVVPVPEYPASLETNEALVPQRRRPDIHPLQAISQYAHSSLEKHPAVSPADRPTDIPSVGNSMNPRYQTITTKCQVTMLPATPTFSALSCGTSKLEIARETARVELPSKWPGAVADGLNPSAMRRTALAAAAAAAARSPCQDPGLEEEQKAFEDVLRKCADNEVQMHVTALPFHPHAYFHRQTSVASSLATTPFASTQASRSTSRSSGTDSLPVTPTTELPIPLDETNPQWAIDASTTIARVPSVSCTPSLPSYKASAIDDTEARLSHTEQLVDFHLLSHHRHQSTCDTAPRAYPQGGSFPDRFVEELFEEGDTAKKLVELQRRSPRKGKVSRVP